MANYRVSAAEIRAAEEARLRQYMRMYPAGATAAPRAPAAAQTAPPAPADPVAQARAAAVAEARAVTAEIGRLCVAAGREDMFTGLLGATVDQAKQALNAALWEIAFDRVHARAGTSPASNTTNAQLWADAFARVDARVAAENGSTTGTPPATDAGGSEDPGALWDRAYDSVRR